jgi:hypothetical protein
MWEDGVMVMIFEDVGICDEDIVSEWSESYYVHIYAPFYMVGSGYPVCRFHMSGSLSLKVPHLWKLASNRVAVPHLWK